MVQGSFRDPSIEDRHYDGERYHGESRAEHQEREQIIQDLVGLAPRTTDTRGRRIVFVLTVSAPVTAHVAAVPAIIVLRPA